MAKFKETMGKIEENISQYWANSRFLNTSLNIKNKYMVLTVTGIVMGSLLGGMGIGGCYNSNMKVQRDNYRREAAELTSQNLSLNERNGLLERKVSVQKDLIKNYNLIVGKSAEQASNIAEIAKKYADGLRGLDESMKKQLKE